ncbi:MAG: BamA/TamA family outer membrane protein [candidate division Zixibacteria bacterium]|nr:BamA/TamA family outer membrane protein [candidate division Zixibacteria bacterium]
MIIKTSLIVLIIAILLSGPVAYAEPVESDSIDSDTLTTSKGELLFLPIIFYSPETKLAGGAAVNYLFQFTSNKDGTRPSSILPYLIYTQEKQIISKVDLDFYWANDKYNLYSEFGYVKFPGKFYGIGNDLDDAEGEDYTPRILGLLLYFKGRIYPGLYLGANFGYEDLKMIETEDGGMLASGDVTGSQGGAVSNLGLYFNRDTRDNMYYPLKGSYHLVSFNLYDSALGSDYEFRQYKLDLRKYVTFTKVNTFAFEILFHGVDRDPPFLKLPNFGDSNVMRGYMPMRYADKNLFVVQAEYRRPIWWKFGIVGFAGFGDVAKEIGKFKINNFKYSFGGGIRYKISADENINVRLDYGIGQGSSGLYIAFAEAF